MKICENAGFKGKVIIEHFEKNDPFYGFDALNENFGNMIEMGIVDPTKVAIQTLRDATSIAGMMLTTEATVVFDIAPISSLVPKK